jgi:hypothetical protein
LGALGAGEPEIETAAAEPQTGAVGIGEELRHGGGAVDQRVKDRVGILAFLHRLGRYPSLDAERDGGAVDRRRAAAAPVVAADRGRAELANSAGRQRRRSGDHRFVPIRHDGRIDIGNAEDLGNDLAGRHVLGSCREQFAQPSRAVPAGQ